jgi:hypothetical protein
LGAFRGSNRPKPGGDPGRSSVVVVVFLVLVLVIVSTVVGSNDGFHVVDVFEVVVVAGFRRSCRITYSCSCRCTRNDRRFHGIALAQIPEEPQTPQTSLLDLGWAPGAAGDTGAPLIAAARRGFVFLFIEFFLYMQTFPDLEPLGSGICPGQRGG